MTTAQTQYNAHQASIRRMLKQIEDHLDAHEKRSSAHPADWGYVGDVSHIDAKLKDLTEGIL